MNAVAGSGFHQVAKIFSQLGAKYGELSDENIAELLPHPTTVTRNIEKIAIKGRECLTDLLELIFTRIGGAISLDGWQDNYKRTNYLGVT